jgi:hypothetical protein
LLTGKKKISKASCIMLQVVRAKRSKRRKLPKLQRCIHCRSARASAHDSHAARRRRCRHAATQCAKRKKPDRTTRHVPPSTLAPGPAVSPRAAISPVAQHARPRQPLRCVRCGRAAWHRRRRAGRWRRGSSALLHWQAAEDTPRPDPGCRRAPAGPASCRPHVCIIILCVCIALISLTRALWPHARSRRDSMSQTNEVMQAIREPRGRGRTL